MTDSKLVELRQLMKQAGIDAFIVGSEDSHLSEYVCDSDMRRAFISGFTGSAGTALILEDKALLWTDGRYFLQAEKELGPDWTLMKSGEASVLDIDDYLSLKLSSGQKVGIDAWLTSTNEAKNLKNKLNSKGIDLEIVTNNLVDQIWIDKPKYAINPVECLDETRAGISHLDKISIIQDILVREQASAFIVTMLDEVAWLLNIRGADVEFNPVVISYAAVTSTGSFWFVDIEKVTEEVRNHLGDSVKILPYNYLENFISEQLQVGRIWIDSTRTNYRIYNAAKDNILEKSSPITLPKSIKNPIEIEGFKNCHIRDGVALTAFLFWLEKSVAANPGTYTEYSISEILEDFRKKMPGHVGPSFSTIAGFGPNGAIIHYKPEKETSSSLFPTDMFLLDSGAQYKDGTTDVTRTLHFGTPSQYMKDAYTAVLKGHIAMASITFPELTRGSRIDAVARLALWKLGLDYNHGTGHGVGSYLNVHEGPQGVGFRARLNEEGFRAGMTISNEPGYYEPNAFGIRIENIYISKFVETPHCFGGKRSLGFETLTLVPIKKNLINLEMLDSSEIDWLNNYHATIREKLLPLMKEYFPEAVAYLLEETNPL